MHIYHLPLPPHPPSSIEAQTSLTTSLPPLPLFPQGAQCLWGGGGGGGGGGGYELNRTSHDHKRKDKSEAEFQQLREMSEKVGFEITFERRKTTTEGNTPPWEMPARRSRGVNCCQNAQFAHAILPKLSVALGHDSDLTVQKYATCCVFFQNILVYALNSHSPV